MSFSKRSRKKRESKEAKLLKAAIRYGSTMLAAGVEESTFYGGEYILVFEKIPADMPEDCQSEASRRELH